jgi:hypothetical protein
MNRQESAETTALLALGWLAGNEELMPGFMNASGVSVADLARDATKPAFLASVLDYLMMEDAWVMAFCDANGLPYEAPMQARQGLPGGAQYHWT